MERLGICRKAKTRQQQGYLEYWGVCRTFEETCCRLISLAWSPPECYYIIPTSMKTKRKRVIIKILLLIQCPSLDKNVSPVNSTGFSASKVTILRWTPGTITEQLLAHILLSCWSDGARLAAEINPPEIAGNSRNSSTPFVCFLFWFWFFCFFFCPFFILRKQLGVINLQPLMKNWSVEY